MKQLLFILMIIVTSSCTHLADKKTGKVASTDGTEIYYERVGQGKVPIVLIHGWCIDHGYWDSTVSALKEEYTVLTLDLGGHGKSGTERAKFTVEKFADDVLAAMDAAGVAKGILVGHSMAGNIMLSVNDKAPNRVIGMIGVDNFSDVGTTYTDSMNAEVENFYGQMEQNYEQMSELFVNQYLFAEGADSSIKNRVLKSILNTPPGIAVSCLRHSYTYGRQTKKKLQQLDKPLQIISCNYMPVDTAALNRYAGDNYALYRMDCPGHYPMIQRPEAFIKNLRIAIESLNY